MANIPALNRRGFLTRGSAATAALASVSTGLANAAAFDAPVLEFPQLGMSQQACLRSFCAADFSVGQLFSVGDAGQTTMVRLIHIATYPAATAQSAPSSRHQPFSLLFVAINDRPLTSKTHEFQGTEGQSFAAFIHPVGSNPQDAPRYEVVFG